MTFSKRLDWLAPPNRLASALAVRRGDLVNLTGSNPAAAGLVHDLAVLAALCDPAALRYDPDPAGLPCAREAIARIHGGSPSRILLTASTSEAYSYLFKLLCDPGDEILVPRPSYPLFEYLARLESVEVRQYSMRYQEGWWIEPDEWARRVSSRTRAIVVVNPNNPTGSYLKAEEIAALDALAVERGIAVISDEVFMDYRLTEDPAPPWPACNALTFRLNGLSKMLGLPQMKLGWIAVEGPDACDAFERLELIADTFLPVGAPVQHAVAAWLGSRGTFQAGVLARLRTNLDAARRWCHPLRVEGGWSAVLPLPRTRTDEEWAIELLTRYGVLIQPGYFYDFESGAYAVVSLITPPDLFEEGMRRIHSAFAVP
ncbi:MAG: pyridoxal phosphate-dependent aminotransferase [Acidobacteria bacterium]|nr:pyridoxal phosphate-dependent aminotransferase [Acidobacteriota bacterium]